jgi:hypothetical protein
MSDDPNNTKPRKAIESPYFNADKLETERTLDPRGRMFADGSDALGNKGYVVDFVHVPSGRRLFFKAFMSAYNETFSPEWSEETVYGRMDPIHQFKNTTRTITVALKIPAASEGEAYENLAKVQALTQFLYPNYVDVGNANTIAQSPLIRFGLMNLARRSTHGSDRFDAPRKISNFEKSGLLGVLTSLTINHNLDSEVGVIERASQAGDAGVSMANRQSHGGILPKLIEINCDFKVIHEHPLGWSMNEDSEDLQFSEPLFPYGMNYDGTRGSEADWATNASARGNYFTTMQKNRADMEEREAVDQAIANAQSRYAGLLGEEQRKADYAAVQAGTATEDQIRNLAASVDYDARLGGISDAEKASFEDWQTVFGTETQLNRGND